MDINTLLIYGGLAALGWAARHWGVGSSLLGGSAATPAPTTPAAPAAPTTPATPAAPAAPAAGPDSTVLQGWLNRHPVISLAWQRFGPQFEALAGQALEAAATNLLMPATTSAAQAPAAQTLRLFSGDPPKPA